MLFPKFGRKYTNVKGLGRSRTQAQLQDLMIGPNTDPNKLILRSSAHNFGGTAPQLFYGHMFSKIIWRPSNRHDRQGRADDISPTKLVDYHATRVIRFVSQLGTCHPIVAAGNSFDTLPSRLKVWRESRRFHPPTHQSVIFMFFMGPNNLTEEVVDVSSSFFG